MAAGVTVMAAAGGPVLNGADAGAAGLKEAAGMYEQLRAEWNRKNLSLSKCGDLLGRLKDTGSKEEAFARPSEKGESQRDGAPRHSAWRMAKRACKM